MVVLFLALLQTAQAAPDIEFHATVDIQSLKIEKRGKATLDVHAEPDGGSAVKVAAPKANGAANLRNVHVAVDAVARIGDPGKIGVGAPQATDAQPPR